VKILCWLAFIILGPCAHAQTSTVAPPIDRGCQPMRGAANIGTRTATEPAAAKVIEDWSAADARHSTAPATTNFYTDCRKQYVAKTTPKPAPPPPPPTPPEPPPTGPVTMPTGAPFTINLSKTPVLAQSPRGGWDKAMIIPATSQPSDSEVGAFRTGCQATVVIADDPIVLPGNPGKSHPHIAFGVVGFDAYMTTASMAAATHSTCRGGTVNKSAYWVPALIDTRTGAPLAPLLESNFYYKRHTAMPTTLKLAPIPQGFRMIAGDSKGTPDKPSNAALYACVWEGGATGWTNYIPTNCRVSGFSWLIVGVDYPSCWDGVNLDSPDHKSHVASAINPGANGAGYCPSSHPVAIPMVAYQILYQVKDANDLKYWRLASDNYDVTKPAGYSGHGDLWSFWDQDIEATWLAGCVNALKDCSSHLLGDGRQLVIP
jgi:Domain of unknown function (DUF1996)